MAPGSAAPLGLPRPDRCRPTAEVTVQATSPSVDDARRLLKADGLLAVDGRIIYQMTDFTLQG